MKSLNAMVAEFGRGRDKAPRKKRANLRNHVLGGTIVGGIAIKPQERKGLTSEIMFSVGR